MNSANYVIIGGGMVAGYAAKELASKRLAAGELIVISADNALPYERPPLSKGFLSGKETETGILINSADWYRDRGIDVRLRTTVDRVDLKNKRIHTDSGEEFEFQKLLLATGARARKLDCAGSELANVFYLRSLQDSKDIRSTAATGKQAVVIGGGFIGMEVASVLARKNVRTTMVIREDRVWSRVFTPQISAFFERYYTARGVQLLKEVNVAALEAGPEHKDAVAAVALTDGRKVPCDMAIAGVGAVPVTEPFAQTGVAIDNGIVVNEYLESNRSNVYAAGDVANYPDVIFDKRRRVEHWDNAVSQGQHWATVILGDRQPFVHVPYFFSDIFDLSYELWGDSAGATQTVSRGDLNTSSFSVWWLKQDRLVAAFVMNRPDEERQAAPEWIKNKRIVSPDRLADNGRPVHDALQQ